MAKTTAAAPHGLKVIRVPVDQLHTDPANARTHDEKNLASIRASLAAFGQVEPLVVHKGTGKVIGGNGRLAVMREMGFTECDVTEFDGSHTQAAALGIALNRTGELAGWDFQALGETFRGLQADGFDLDATGFAPHELEPILAADWEPAAVGDLPGHDDEKEGGDAGDKGDSIFLTREQRKAFDAVSGAVREALGDDDAEDGRVVAWLATFFAEAGPVG